MADIPESRSKRPSPDSARAKKGMSLNALLKNTPAYVKNKARDELVIKSLSKVWTKGGMRAVRALVVNMMKKAPDPHTVTIIGLDAKYVGTGLKKSQIPKLYAQKRLQVDCTCGFFTFYCEVALWEHGAAKIRRSNGEHPVVTNPSLIPLVCKHAVAVLREIKEYDL
jgi:hypothetical protein